MKRLQARKNLALGTVWLALAGCHDQGSAKITPDAAQPDAALVGDADSPLLADAAVDAAADAPADSLADAAADTSMDQPTLADTGLDTLPDLAVPRDTARPDTAVDSAIRDVGSDGLPTPIEAGTGSRVIQVAAGGRFTCALTAEGAVKCWGHNADMQLGDGTLTPRSKPAPVVGLPWAPTRIVAGWAFACGLRDGTLACWGRGTEGQMGDGTLLNRGRPAIVPGLSDIRAVGAGSAHHICAATKAGALKCWGFNAYGQLCDGTTDNRSTPIDMAGVSDVEQISIAMAVTCIATTTGTMRCWGGNFYGQLGDGTTTTRTQPVEPIGLGPVTAMATNNAQTCAILRSDGSVMCWGDNTHGELGDGTKEQRRTPVAVLNLKGAVGLVAGVYHTCALLGDGTVQCWGFDQDGELGDGVLTSRSTPAPVYGVANATQISAGDYHTCALIADGSVYCWGNGKEGQLGPGNPVIPWGAQRVEGI
jgi:alpha-tubulin suppressor-like RCC1 family protein